MSPFDASLVSLPREVWSSPPLATVLSAGDRLYVEGVGDMVLVPDEEFAAQLADEGPAKAYVDPAVSKGPIHASVVRKFVNSGMVQIATQARCECGLFFVKKKKKSAAHGCQDDQPALPRALEHLDGDRGCNGEARASVVASSPFCSLGGGQLLPPPQTNRVDATMVQPSEDQGEVLGGGGDARDADREGAAPVPAVMYLADGVRLADVLRAEKPRIGELTGPRL